MLHTITSKTNTLWLALSLALVSPIYDSIFPNNALADERWSTNQSDVTYEEDRGSTAIWSYEEGNGTIFIDGLAGVYTDRGSYSGYWTQDTSSRRCDTFREGSNGEPTYHWGSFEITFINPDFPSSWYAKFGLCDGEPTIPLEGTPLVGDVDLNQ